MWSVPHPPSQFAKGTAANVDIDLRAFDSVLLVQHFGMATDPAARTSR